MKPREYHKGPELEAKTVTRLDDELYELCEILKTNNIEILLDEPEDNQFLTGLYDTRNKIELARQHPEFPENVHKLSEEVLAKINLFILIIEFNVNAKALTIADGQTEEYINKIGNYVQYYDNDPEMKTFIEYEFYNSLAMLDPSSVRKLTNVGDGSNNKTSPINTIIAMAENKNIQIPIIHEFIKGIPNPDIDSVINELSAYVDANNNAASIKKLRLLIIDLLLGNQEFHRAFKMLNTAMRTSDSPEFTERLKLAAHKCNEFLEKKYKRGNPSDLEEIKKYYAIDGFTPSPLLIFDAAGSKNPEVLRFICEKLSEDDIRKKTVGNKNIAHFAAQNNCVENLRYISQKFPALLNETANGESVMFTAVSENNREAVSFLTSIKCCLDDENANHQSPLSRAYQLGYFEIFDDLLKAGANPNVIHPHYKSYSSLFRGNWYYGDALLHAACNEKKYKFARALLGSDKINVRIKNEENKSAEEIVVSSQPKGGLFGKVTGMFRSADESEDILILIREKSAAKSALQLEKSK